MMTCHTAEKPKDRRRGLLRRFWRRKDGATAIEFTILCIPFFMITFASIETFVAFTAEQLLANATETMARKIRTGEITYLQGKTSDMSAQEFRQAFCEEISILMPCSETEVNQPSKLWIDVRSFATFAEIPKAIPRKGTEQFGDLDTSGFAFSPGGKQTINIVRAYYRWEIVTDLIRPYVSNVRPEGDVAPKDYLIVATTVVQNENYP
jgi:Flp pilus assembly protein TadG